MKKILLIFTACCLLTATIQAQNPLLEKYRSMALHYNHDLNAAEKNIAASMELENMARADKKPKLSGGANFEYTGNPMELTINLPSASAPVTFQGQNSQYGAAVSLLQPVYTGGRVLESIRMAKHQHSLASNQAGLVRSAVCFQTDIQYWNTVARVEMAGIADEHHSSMASLVNTIKERVEAGLVDPQDLLMAEVKLNEAEYRLLQVQSELETGRMALNSLIGVDLNIATEVEPIVPPVASYDSLLLAAGTNRPEIRMAHDQIKLEESASVIADSKYKPQLYIGADGSYSSPGYNFKADFDPNYAVYAKLSVPIFEWGKRRSEKRASQQRVGMATDNLAKTEDKVSLEVQTARTALLQAMKRVDLAASSLDKARENEQQARERYDGGKISILELIEAQTYRQTAHVNHAEAKAAAQIYYSELLRASNGYEATF